MSMERECMQCFSLVMVYVKVLYSTSNGFPYATKNFINFNVILFWSFLNIKQYFSFMSWFCVYSLFYWVTIGRNGKENFQILGMSRPYRRLSIIGGVNLLHMMLWTIVLLTKLDKYSISASSVLLFYLLFRCTVVDFWAIIDWIASLTWY